MRSQANDFFFISLSSVSYNHLCIYTDICPLMNKWSKFLVHKHPKMAHALSAKDDDPGFWCTWMMKYSLLTDWVDKNTTSPCCALKCIIGLLIPELGTIHLGYLYMKNQSEMSLIQKNFTIIIAALSASICLFAFRTWNTREMSPCQPSSLCCYRRRKILNAQLCSSTKFLDFFYIFLKDDAKLRHL